MKRVLVCGTTFGQVYLEGLAGSGSRHELAGILGQGSERSRACARRYGVPLFTAVDDLPGDIDIACVVVRGGLLGGPGTELAKRLMHRGIHVLQEQPLHHDEVAECLRVARKQRVRYRVNSFYSYLPITQRFIAAAAELLRRRPPRYVEAACSIQVGYPLIAVLVAALGNARPWRFEPSPPAAALRSLCAERRLFQRVDGVLSGVWTSLSVQNQIHPSDPDDYAQLLHRVTIGTEAGDLLLVTSHGPIVWSARPEIPREVRDSGSRHLFGEAPVDPSGTCTELMSPGDEPSQRRLFLSHWPEAVRQALADFDALIDAEGVLVQADQHQLTLCRIWQDVSAAIGPPELIAGDQLPRGLSDEDLAAIRTALKPSATRFDRRP